MGLTPVVNVRLPQETKNESRLRRFFEKFVIRPEGYEKPEPPPRMKSIHSLDVTETTDEELDARIEKIRKQFEQHEPVLHGFTTTSSIMIPPTTTTTPNYFQSFWGDGPYGDQPDPKNKLGIRKELR